MGGGAAGGQSWERAAAGVEETDPTVQQSQPRYGLSHPGGLSFPTAAQEGTLAALLLLHLCHGLITDFSFMCGMSLGQSVTRPFFPQAYNLCKTEREKTSLLSDLLIRRGEGVTSTTRRVGPELSKRLFLMMNSCDPEQTLDSTV